MRVALFGSPSFAIPTLQALNERHDLVLVVTQPDKPVGRGLKLKSPPAAQAAKALGFRLAQPPKLRNNKAFHSLLEDLKLDVAVTAAYGQILPQSLLDIPRHGFLNVHASLLPKYRGAAPIQWALINGETETGISIMQTEAGLDTGPVRRVERLAIKDEDTAESLFFKLAELGAHALVEALGMLESGSLPSDPQDDNQATHAPMFTKDDGRIRWDESATAIHNRYRGVLAWPGSWTHYKDAAHNKVLKVHELEPAPNKGDVTGKPGEILNVSKEGVEVAAAENSVLLKTVQPPNKAKMSAFDWANGYGVKVGQVLGNAGVGGNGG